MEMPTTEYVVFEDGNSQRFAEKQGAVAALRQARKEGKEVVARGDGGTWNLKGEQEERVRWYEVAELMPRTEINAVKRKLQRLWGFSVDHYVDQHDAREREAIGNYAEGDLLYLNADDADFEFPMLEYKEQVGFYDTLYVGLDPEAGTVDFFFTKSWGVDEEDGILVSKRTRLTAEDFLHVIERPAALGEAAL